MSDAPARLDPDCRDAAPAITVVKIGGSVLTGPPAYRRAARFIADRLAESPTRLVVIVSAEQGLTDALLSAAREFSADPDPDALDLLWSTGEVRSVALLTLALHALGLRATGVNVHQAGVVEREAAGGRRTAIRALRLRSLLTAFDVVVVPGFLARGAGDRIVSLGRGGSDLSAVTLAAGLGAAHCELIKDVPGYFSADPNRHPDARHLETLDYRQALAMADDGCELVQRDALAAARDGHLTLLVRAIGDRRVTRLGVKRQTPNAKLQTPNTSDRERLGSLEFALWS